MYSSFLKTHLYYHTHQILSTLFLKNFYLFFIFFILFRYLPHTTPRVFTGSLYIKYIFILVHPYKHSNNQLTNKLNPQNHNNIKSLKKKNKLALSFLKVFYFLWIISTTKNQPPKELISYLIMQ